MRRTTSRGAKQTTINTNLVTEEGEDISFNYSRHIRMPGPIVQASPGGITPMEGELISKTNKLQLKRMRQPRLVLPVEKEEKDGKEVPREEPAPTTPYRKEHWVQGGQEEDNQRYREFLTYCEERRTSWSRLMEEESARKEEAKRKEEHWKLLRESIKYLRENEENWQLRRIQEVTRIKEEEKIDRLAIVKEKKKRYGIQKLNKEENKRLRERTEGRILVSQQKQITGKNGEKRRRKEQR